jgi:hypothetical protein
MGISFFVLCCVPFCSSNWFAERQFFSEKTLNWHGFSNIFRVILANRSTISTGSGGCYFFV